jgi:hypothetical protein
MYMPYMEVLQTNGQDSQREIYVQYVEYEDKKEGWPP